MLNNNAKIWIYYLENTPICSMMTVPSTKTTPQDYNVELDYKDIICYGTMMVKPEYVGKGLQLQMLKELDEYSKKNNYKYLLGTIHPENTFSINNFISSGYDLVSQKQFKRGLRRIYIKDLTK